MPTQVSQPMRSSSRRACSGWSNSGAASGSVLGRALTRDAYSFKEMPLVMSWISLGQNIAPSLAPTLGGFLGEWASWRATFWFVGGFGALRALSTRNDDPTHASRPFDKDRDG